ncbi:MAG: ATP-binding cassette domain-containing protein [Flavobacteriaceae bacterium]|jgi:ABC-2 type transport system ATP-binding protein|nr:ATP-binding cassette domain-containing protein [Flavobacteriaceae bacterium]MBT3919716.1 ATP-binding cassette domain-containing protein [Flavobacteriaceae bacterium]MBT6705434.1 ATP-binding cassette domain-containing protein [Flavobacteriaceae bacterium]
MVIKIENITKKYGDQIALNQVSFSIPKGEIVGFLGPNGAGKSTMMKILTTYISTFEGNAWVNNYSVSDDKIQVQKCVGYLPEHNPLYTDMYVREYLNFNAEVYKIDKAHVEIVIEQTGLLSEAHKKIEQLSKGYRQRVGLANALLHNPEVLILDEPTTGLDPNQLIEIRDLIKKVAKENGKTVLLSTHIMQEVEAICDRVIILNKGKLIHDKSIKETLKETSLENLFTKLTSQK